MMLYFKHPVLWQIGIVTCSLTFLVFSITQSVETTTISLGKQMFQRPPIAKLTSEETRGWTQKSLLLTSLYMSL